jgi:hypothetical protein
MGAWRATLAVAAVGTVLACPAVAAKEEAWEGTLKASPAVQLRLVFHVKEGPGGALSATMDSPDQGTSDFPVTAVTRDKSRLTFEMKNLDAKFDGKLNAAGTEAAGTFTQRGQSFPMTLKKSDAPSAGAKPAANEQVWEGKLKVGLVQLRMVFHIFTEPKGDLRATFDSPDQGARGLRVDAVTLDKTKLTFEMKALDGKFEGKLNEAGDEAAGTWTQRGASYPLTLEQTNRVVGLRRP